MVIRAVRELRKIQRRAAHLHEIPIAVAWSRYLNGHQRPGTKPVPWQDCTVLGEPKDSTFPPVAAAVMMALRHEGKGHPMLLAPWPDVVEAVQQHNPAIPDVRAYVSADREVWIIAPEWDGASCRAQVAGVADRRSGWVEVADIDRPLITYRLQLPERPGNGWIATELVLPAAN